MSECEIPEFYEMTNPTASKNHKCCECGALIEKGEKYVSCTGYWGDGVETYKQHQECKDACVLIRDEFNEGECIGFGELMSEYQQWLEPSQWHKKQGFAKVKEFKNEKGIKELRHLMAVIFNRRRKRK